jgi:general secretion pathway protein F
MTRYHYKASTADGVVVNGVLMGQTRHEIVEQLRAQNQIPIRIDEVSGDQPAADRRARQRGRRRGITQQQIADTTRELATLLRAGMPLEKAVGVLAGYSAESDLGTVLSDIRTGLQQGSTFSEAVGQHIDLFGQFYVNLLKAGESGGALEVIMVQLADHIDRSIDLKDAIKTALTYPALLIIVATLSILILLGYVVPQFTQIFEGVNSELPAATQITIAIGEFVKTWGWLMILGGVGFGTIVRRQLASPRHAMRWHARMLRIPLAGPVVLKIEVARFSRILALLLNNGIPLLQALGIVRETMTNRVLAAEVGDVATGLKDGANLAQPLSRSKHFPSFAVHMINVGEESGNLAEILDQVADTYDRDTAKTIKRALSILEPVLILVLGTVIAAVIISILVAIVGINDLVI